LVTIGGQFRHRITHLSFLSGMTEQFYYQDFSAFVQAQPTLVAITEGNPGYPFSESTGYFFADDRWRIKDGLTLSFGLAYQNSTQPLGGLAARVRARETGSSELFDPSLPLDLRTISAPHRNNPELAPRFG